ncbi:unannotated protein [freshwater metagenome]|uniref:Unannotated protein n=1 Tax=freshwater metagenome TaxID=449393 RepID=A0A6J7AU70_9ZZZZ
MSALCFAQQVAGTADFEVAHRDLEAAAKFGGLADRAQALVRVLAETRLGRVEQVRIRTRAAASHTTAQLVHLAKAQQVGAFDHERVHRGHVDTALDDRGAHEHVVAALPEVDDDLLERTFVHLAVSDRDPRFGNEFAQTRGGGVDRLHPVVHPEDLALAQQLATDRLHSNSLVITADEREDRLAIGRRGLQQRQVANADEAHLQRAGNRRGGQRQHVDVVLHLLHRLLRLHAEALFLVDDE